MDTSLFKEMIDVIKTEQERRTLNLGQIYPDVAYDQWQFKDKPFINEFYLMLLVTLRHQVERELIEPKLSDSYY